MAIWRVNNSTALGGEVCSQWQASHAYSLGARCVCTTDYATTAARAVVFECTTAGTSGGTQPTWDYTVGNTTTDDGVTWTARSPSDGSWDNASCILHYVLNHTTIAAGDTVYIDDGHNEVGLSLAYILKGSSTLTNLIKIYCVDKADDSLSTGAIVGSQTGKADATSRGGLYSYGVTYNCACQMRLTSYSDLLILESNGSAVLNIGVDETWKPVGYLTIGSQSNIATVIVKNASIGFNDPNQYISVQGAGYFHWRGGSLTGTAPAKLFSGGAYGGKFLIEDVDLSNLGNNSVYNVAATASFQDITLTRCKMPAAYKLTTGTWLSPLNGNVVLHHCSSDNATYDFTETLSEGTISDETTITRTGGASDGTTSLAMKMVSSAGIVEGTGIALESPPIHAWTSSTTSKTFTIEGIWDSAANIQDDEIWMELEYPANATDGLGAIAKDKCAILGTPADQTASTETWTTTGMTNPNKFKLSVTVTPGKAGPITARVYLAKPSTTVYIDPLITES